MIDASNSFVIFKLKELLIFKFVCSVVLCVSGKVSHAYYLNVQKGFTKSITHYVSLEVFYNIRRKNADGSCWRKLSFLDIKYGPDPGPFQRKCHLNFC